MAQQFDSTIIQRIRGLRQNSFIKHNAVYFIGTMGVSVFNYAYYPVISRFLNLHQFGEAQFLLSTLLQATTILTSFGLVVLYFTSNRDDDPHHIAAIQALEATFLYVTIFLGALLLLISPAIQTFFQLSYPATVVMFAVLLVMNVPLIFRSSILQGLQRFWKAAEVGMTASISKLVIAVGLMLAGYTMFGVFASLVIAHVLAVGYAYYLTSKTVPFTLKISWNHLRVLWQRVRFVAFVVGLTTLGAIIYGLDVLAVRHYFSPETAGGYAGVSTSARILFFLTSSVATVLVASVRPTLSAVQNRRILLRSLALALLLGGAGLAALCVSPTWTLSVIVGSQYTSYAYLLTPLCGAVLLTALLNVWFCYYIALQEYIAIVLTAIGVVVTTVLMATHHGTLLDIILNLALGSGIILVMFTVYEGIKLTRATYVQSHR